MQISECRMNESRPWRDDSDTCRRHTIILISDFWILHYYRLRIGIEAVA